MKGWTNIEVAFAILGYVFAGFMVFMMIVYIAMLVLNARTPTPHPSETPANAGAQPDNDHEPAARDERP